MALFDEDDSEEEVDIVNIEGVRSKAKRKDVSALDLDIKIGVI